MFVYSDPKGTDFSGNAIWWTGKFRLVSFFILDCRLRKDGVDCDNVSCWIADYLNWLRQRAVTVGRIDRNRIEWRYCDANAALDDDRVGRDNRSGRKWRQKTTFALMSRSVVDQSYRLGSVTDGRPVPVVRRRRVRRTQSLGSGAIRRNGAGSAAEPPPWPRPIDPARDRPFPHSHPAVASEAVVSSAATTNGVRSGPPRIRHRDRVKPVFPRCAKGADSTAGVFTSKCVVTPTRRPYMNNTTAAIDFLFPVVPPPGGGDKVKPSRFYGSRAAERTNRNAGRIESRFRPPGFVAGRRTQPHAAETSRDRRSGGSVKSR